MKKQAKLQNDMSESPQIKQEEAVDLFLAWVSLGEVVINNLGDEGPLGVASTLAIRAYARDALKRVSWFMAETSNLAIELDTIDSLSYTDYLLTNVWATIRRKVLAEYGGRCVVCGATEQLNVHHRNYGSPRGMEDPTIDLVVLCQPCHAKHHGIIGE